MITIEEKRKYARDFARERYKNNEEYREKRKIYMRQYMKTYYKNNEEQKIKRKNYMTEYFKKHKPKRKKKLIKFNKTLKKEINKKPPIRKYSENQRIAMRLRTLVNKAMNLYIKTGRFQQAKKYSVNYKSIIEHLKPIPINRYDYHIDHIKPLKLFDLLKKSDIKKAFAPENHQWLLKKDNWSKAAKF